MSPKYRTEGFVFKERDFREADKIYSLFTESFGRIDVLGRGIRKIRSKLRGYMVLFDFVEIELVQGKLYKTLTDAVSIERLRNIRKDPLKLEISFKIANLLDVFLKGEEKEERLWELLKEVFLFLNKKTISPFVIKISYFYFFWNFLYITGYFSSLEKCSMCSRSLGENVYFNPEEATVLCERCHRKIKKGYRISIDALKLIKVFRKKDLQFVRKIRIDKSHIRELEKISGDYLSFINH